MYNPEKTDADRESGGQYLARMWREGLEMPAAMTITQWADEYRYIAGGMSPIAGKWVTDRMPHLAEIMDALSPSHPCTDVTFMGSSQTSGKSDSLINLLAYHVHHDPDSMLLVVPNHKQIKRMSKRFDRNAEATPVLRDALRPRSRKDANSAELKEFDGGMLYFASSESPSDLASVTCRIVAQDEVDRYPQDVEGEGDPAVLADARTTMYGPRAKRYKASSPTVEALSRVNRAFLLGDQSYRHVPCPHCGEYQRLVWDGLKWPEGNPKAAYCVCQANGCVIEEHHKQTMLRNDVAKWVPKFPERSLFHRSFQISALYSPIGLGKKWGELAQEFVDCKGEKTKLKVFVNTRLGETWVDNDEKVDWERVKERAEKYPLRRAPSRCLLFTAAVDVQKDRFEYLIVGWCRDRRATVIDHGIIMAETAVLADYQAIEAYLKRPVETEFGTVIVPDIALIDSGYQQSIVLQFTRAHKADRWYGTKGASRRNAPLIGRPRKVDVKINEKPDRWGADQYEIGTDVAKDWIYANLRNDAKRDNPNDRVIRFSEKLSEDFFKQLCIEVFDPHKQRYDKPPGARNEALDLMVLCFAGAHHPNIRMDKMRDTDWDARMALHGQGRTLDLLAAVAAPADDQAPPPAPVLVNPLGAADQSMLALLGGERKTTTADL